MSNIEDLGLFELDAALRKVKRPRGAARST